MRCGDGSKATVAGYGAADIMAAEAIYHGSQNDVIAARYA
jgi:hypothetical protein